MTLLTLQSIDASRMSADDIYLHLIASPSQNALPLPISFLPSKSRHRSPMQAHRPTHHVKYECKPTSKPRSRISSTSRLRALRINSIRQRCQCDFSQPCHSRRPQRHEPPHASKTTSISASPRSPSFSVCSPSCSQSLHSPSPSHSSRSMTVAFGSIPERVV